MEQQADQEKPEDNLATRLQRKIYSAITSDFCSTETSLYTPSQRILNHSIDFEWNEGAVYEVSISVEVTDFHPRNLALNKQAAQKGDNLRISLVSHSAPDREVIMEFKLASRDKVEYSSEGPGGSEDQVTLEDLENIDKTITYGKASAIKSAFEVDKEVLQAVDPRIRSITQTTLPSLSTVVASLDNA